MKCDIFSNWLEEKDLHDVSEADQALKHTETCENCRDLFHKDECLNLFVADKMKPVPIPDKLKNRIDLNLEQQGLFEKRSTLWWQKGIPLALAAMLILYVMMPFSKRYETLNVMGGDIVADHVGHSDAVMVVHDLDELKEYCASALGLSVTKPKMPDNYTFVGARVCPLGEHRSVHLAYMVDGKRVSLFIVKAEDTKNALGKGEKYEVAVGEYNIEFWREQDKIYALIT